MNEGNPVMEKITEACLRHADQQHREALQRLAHTVSLAQSGLHASVLINGGALIGLFTLIAPQRDLAEALWPAGLAFAIALALTVAGWLAATVSQDRFQFASVLAAWNAESIALGREPKRDFAAAMRTGARSIRAAYGCVTASTAAFITGALLTLAGLA